MANLQVLLKGHRGKKFGNRCDKVLLTRIFIKVSFKRVFIFVFKYTYHGRCHNCKQIIIVIIIDIIMHIFYVCVPEMMFKNMSVQ